MLAGRGFNKVYNLAGGIKAWDSPTAVGGEELGLALFSGKELPEEFLIVAYSLEQGLRDFYLSLLSDVDNADAKDLFRKLAGIEVVHMERVFNEYLAITKKELSREEFEKGILVKAIEGGLTTEEYIKLLNPNWETTRQIVACAMSIEAQALDLYQRASERSRNKENKEALGRIASEEQTHLKLLGDLMEKI